MNTVGNFSSKGPPNISGEGAVAEQLGKSPEWMSPIGPRWQGATKGTWREELTRRREEKAWVLGQVKSRTTKKTHKTFCTRLEKEQDMRQ